MQMERLALCAPECRERPYRRGATARPGIRTAVSSMASRARGVTECRIGLFDVAAGQEPALMAMVMHQQNALAVGMQHDGACK